MKEYTGIDWDDFEIEEDEFIFIINKKQSYSRDKYVYIKDGSRYFSDYTINSRRKIDVRELNGHEIRLLKHGNLKVRIFEGHRWNTYSYNELIKMYSQLKRY